MELPNDLPPWAVVYQQMQRWLQSQNTVDANPVISYVTC